MMITFVIVGEMIGRRGFIINSIAASAFVLLCINPYNLFEIGFQLSYAAVMGIVVLQKPIYNLFYVKNKLLDKAWEITTVALAAQIATVPFTLFYFHQFTSYFWLSNLFMTPISFVVIISGMVLLLVSWIPYVNVVVGYLVWGAVYVMNAFVSWVEGLPMSIIKGLYISEFEFAMLILAFVLLLLMVASRKKRLFIPILSVLLLVMVSVTLRLYKTDGQSGMTFFSLRNHTAVDFVRGGEHVLLADTALMDDASTVDYSLRGAWTKRHLVAQPETIGFDQDFENAFLRKKDDLISFGGKLLALWEGQRYADSLSYRLSVDYLLVRERQTPDVQSVVNGFAPKLLVIDGSVPRYLAERWMIQATESELACYDLSEGALVTDWGGY
jgi:competence protein ComEC